MILVCSVAPHESRGIHILSFGALMSPGKDPDPWYASMGGSGQGDQMPEQV